LGAGGPDAGPDGLFQPFEGLAPVGDLTGDDAFFDAIGDLADFLEVVVTGLLVEILGNDVVGHVKCTFREKAGSPRMSCRPNFYV
jgi:hypothetical protein